MSDTVLLWLVFALIAVSLVVNIIVHIYISNDDKEYVKAKQKKARKEEQKDTK